MISDRDELAAAWVAGVGYRVGALAASLGVERDALEVAGGLLRLLDLLTDRAEAVAAERDRLKTECPHGYYGWSACGICGPELSKARARAEQAERRLEEAKGLLERLCNSTRVATASLAGREVWITDKMQLSVDVVAARAWLRRQREETAAPAVPATSQGREGAGEPERRGERGSLPVIRADLSAARNDATKARLEAEELLCKRCGGHAGLRDTEEVPESGGMCPAAIHFAARDVVIAAVERDLIRGNGTTVEAMIESRLWAAVARLRATLETPKP